MPPGRNPMTAHQAKSASAGTPMAATSESGYGVPSSAAGAAVASSLPSELGCLPAFFQCDCFDTESVGTRADLSHLDDLGDNEEGVSNFFLSVVHTVPPCGSSIKPSRKLFNKPVKQRKLHKDRETLLRAIERNPLALEQAEDFLCADRELVLTAVSMNGRCFPWGEKPRVPPALCKRLGTCHRE